MPAALRLALIAALVVPGPAAGESVVAVRVIRAQTIVAPGDIAVRAERIDGALRDPADAIGKETRVNIYAGRPIRAADLAPPAIVARNDVVVLNYHHAGLMIATEGRALDRAGVGQRIRVLNLNSRATVTGTVMIDGSVSVAPLSN